MWAFIMCSRSRALHVLFHLDPITTITIQILLSYPFYRCVSENWGQKRLSNSPKVPQPVKEQGQFHKLAYDTSEAQLLITALYWMEDTQLSTNGQSCFKTIPYTPWITYYRLSHFKSIYKTQLPELQKEPLFPDRNRHTENQFIEQS